jgi:hypothetical protein
MWRMALGIVDGSQKMEAEVFRKGVAGSEFQRGEGPALTVMPQSDRVYILHTVFLQTYTKTVTAAITISSYDA